MGSCCGTVGRAVASDTRGPRFESSHRQNFINVFTINCIEKTKIKKKETVNGPFKKTQQLIQACITFYLLKIAAVTRVCRSVINCRITFWGLPKKWKLLFKCYYSRSTNEMK